MRTESKDLSAAKYKYGDARRFLSEQVSRFGFPNIDRWAANDKDFSLALEMTIRESDVFLVSSS